MELVETDLVEYQIEFVSDKFVCVAFHMNCDQSLMQSLLSTGHWVHQAFKLLDWC